MIRPAGNPAANSLNKRRALWPVQTALTPSSVKLFLMSKSSFSGPSRPAPIPPFAVYVKKYRWVVAWCVGHFAAMLLSYNEVRYFNETGEPSAEKFWPFVKFTYPYFLPNNNKTYYKFNGFFTEYDWTEFSFYTGTVIFFIILAYVYKKSK